uniref:G_PROTEIN_RECEP_F1_2 domain-containing protein n=1 Tax=Parastrongyloides trichosuri TaxID=131310 RepID=A0A0N5A318_PARTI
MNISKTKLDDDLEGYIYYLQRSQLYISTIAIFASSLVLILFYKHNVFHDNFRAVFQALTGSIIVNNFLIFFHAHEGYRNNYQVDWNAIDKFEYFKQFKGNIQICDQYSPVPSPLMFINIVMLFILAIERTIAMRLYETYEKLQLGNIVYYFSLPLWCFSLLLFIYDCFAVYGIEENVLYNFCHCTFIQKYYWFFSTPYFLALIPLVIFIYIFFENYGVAKGKKIYGTKSMDDYLSARFQMMENIRSNGFLAFFTTTFTLIILFYNLSLFFIDKPSGRIVTFFNELAYTSISVFTIIFYMSMIYIIPAFYNNTLKLLQKIIDYALISISWKREKFLSTVKKN